MAKSWSDVAASSAFQALSFDEKEEARWQYFDSVIAPQVPEEDLDSVRSLFDTDTQLSQPLPEGVVPSQAGGGRGAVNPEPASPYTTAKSIAGMSAFDRESDASAVIAGVGDDLTSPSVIYGAELPEQKPLIERRGAPVSEQKFQELRGIYDRSTPDARKQLLDLGGFEGSVYRSIDDQYKEIQSSRLRGAVDTRAEMQRQDEIKPSKFDFATKAEYARPKGELAIDEAGGMLSARRVGPTGAEEIAAATKAIGGKISGQFASSTAGAWQLIGDLASAAGASEFGQRMSAGSAEEQRIAKAKLEAIGENPNAVLNFIESGVSGAVTNIAPFMLGGTTGLAAIGVQVFGDEYGSGKLAGLSPTDSFKRATAMTAAEIIGEKANMPTKLLGTFKKAMRGVPADQIMPEFGRFLVRENFSEQVTNAMRFGTDKWASFGLTPNATMDDYLNAVNDTFQQTMAQTLVTGGVGAGVTGLVRKIESAQPAEQQFARALEQSVEQSRFLTPASELAARRMSADSQDLRMVRPDQTVRQPGDIGPAPMVNFTEPDSDSAKAGLTPIVVPVPTQQPAAFEPVSVGGAATEPTNVSPAVEPTAQVTVQPESNRPFERATDQELLSRIPGYKPTPVGAGDTGEPAPVGAGDTLKFKRQWVGRKGDGYVTEADASQALPGRQKMFPDLQWRIEQMADGKYRLAGYEFQTKGDVVGTQTTQAVQTAAQGTEAATETAAGTEAAEVPDTALAGVSLVGDEDQVRGAVQQRLNDWAATQPGMTAPVLGKPDADAEATVNVLGNLFGEATGVGQNRVIAFSDPGGGVNGFATSGMAFVNTAEDTTVSAPRTTLHEIKHVVEQIASADTKAGRNNTPAQQFVAEVDSIFDDMTDEGKRSYVENFLHKEELDAIADPAKREQRVQELMQAPKTRSEMVADFMGNRAHDREFLLDLAAQDPGGFKSFVDKWLNVIDNLIAKLKGAPKATKQESDKVDSYVKDLNKAKMVARDALIKFRKGNLGSTAEIAAEGDVAASKASQDFKFSKTQGEPISVEAKVEPEYKFVVIDPRNNNKVMGKYKSRSTALRGRDRLDNAYGAYRYQVQRIDDEGPKMSLAQGEDIGAKLKARIDSDFDGAAQEYSQLKGTKGGRLLDTDIARELSPEYQQDRSRSAEVHEAASAFTQRLFEQRMNQPGTGDIVVFMAGGGGSGKSSAETLLSPVLDRASTILDGTLSSYDKARRNVKMALDSGRQVRIAYVYRDPEEAVRNGVLTRAMRGGRTVPVDALVKGHAGSSNVVRKLQAEFSGNPKFKIFAVDNSKGPGAAQIAPLESITPVIIDGLKERFINATEEEYKAGRISESVYRATVGSQADAAARTEGETGVREVRQGSGSPVQEGRGSERAGDAVSLSSKETAADHKLTVTREERELADKTKLTRDELAKIKESAQRFNLPPRTVEMEVRRIKSRFPESAGWAPLEFLRVDPKVMEKKAKEGNPLPSDAIFFVEQPYQFHLDPQAGKDAKETHDKRVNNMASALAGEIMEKYMASQRGDPIAKIIMRQSDWYRALRSKLRSTFGGFGDFFAQLLGPTSANNPVEPNFKYAVEALKMATSGKWDNMFKEIAAWRADIDAAAANLDAVIATVKAAGGKAVMSDPRVIDAKKALKEAAVYKGTVPKRENGKMFGMATTGIVQILGERWGDKQMGDAPKTKNYYQNIVGRTIEATIDVWAARTMRRLANDTVGNFPRIPTVAEGAVAGSVLADNVTSGSEFGFGQEVFRKAADELRASGIEQFRDTTPDAVQAMIWFAEKELWARRGWTSKIGEEGSIEHELLLAGYADREQVDKWRSAARAGKPNPDSKAFQLKDAEKAKQKYEKAVGEWSEAKRAAEEMLAQIERYPDRFVGGITLEIPNGKPTDSEMAAAERELDQTIGDDRVIAKRAQTTTGEFMGDVERTIDLEFVVRNGYNPAPVWGKMVEISDREGQMATFLSRTLRADELESVDYTRHRPGVELYFAKPISKFDAAALMAVINNAGVHGMTLATEGRKTVSSQAGEEQPIVGIRLQHIPEFMLGYGYEADFTDAIIEQNILDARDKMTALVEELDKRADISTVTRHWYETKVHFYGINERTAAAGSAEGDRQVWAGQSIREGLADAARFARENQDALETRRAEVFREREVSRGGAEQDSIQFSKRATGPAELARGPGARSDEGTGRAVTGIHYGKFAGLSSLNASSFGSGIKGAEHERLSRPGVDPRIKKRVYFYLTSSDTDMPRPETGLGSHVYRATLGNMFDMSTATQEQKAKVQSLRKTSDANGFESAVLDAGFRGYVNREQGTAVVLNSNVPVAYEGLAQAGKMRDRIIQRTVPKNETRQSGDELVRRPTNEELMFIIKAKPELAEAAPSFKLQFGEARVKQSESQAADRVLAEAGSKFRFNDTDSTFAASKQQPGAATLAEDLERQQVFLQERAELAGYKDVDEFVENDYPAFEQATREWREQNPAEMLLAKKQAPKDAASEEAELASIFKQLDNARGKKLKKAKADAAKHPLAGRIAMVNENFYDILEKLDDAGVIKINCK